VQVWTHAPYSAELHSIELRWNGLELGELCCYAARLSAQYWRAPLDVPLPSRHSPEDGFLQGGFPRDSHPEQPALPWVTFWERDKFLPLPGRLQRHDR